MRRKIDVDQRNVRGRGSRSLLDQAVEIRHFDDLEFRLADQECAHPNAKDRMGVSKNQRYFRHQLVVEGSAVPQGGLAHTTFVVHLGYLG